MYTWGMREGFTLRVYVSVRACVKANIQKVDGVNSFIFWTFEPAFAGFAASKSMSPFFAQVGKKKNTKYVYAHKSFCGCRNILCMP